MAQLTCNSTHSPHDGLVQYTLKAQSPLDLTWTQLDYYLEMCSGSCRPAAHHGCWWWLGFSRQHAACLLTSLQLPHGQWHLLVLICEAYAVIHLWCYGCGGRFMTQNKLLRSCMWWGNQEGKWAGNSLLHATLIHPSVWKKKIPRHYAQGSRSIIAGPQYTNPRSAARSAEVSPSASGLSEGFQNSSINSPGISLVCAQHEAAFGPFGQKIGNSLDSSKGFSPSFVSCIWCVSK